jgi:hypothetical protein
MSSEQPGVTVKISSKVETLPTGTTNYNVCNDHQEIECGYLKRPKTHAFFVKLKNLPRLNSEA